MHARTLPLAAFGLFLLLLLAQSVAGSAAYNHELRQHRLPVVGYVQFLSSGRFIEAAAENWEGELLGLVVYVLVARGVLQRRARRAQLAVLLLSFAGSLLLHAVSGWHDYNHSQEQHGEAAVSLMVFMRSAEFWFQSVQNWQSAFLGLGIMMALGIVSERAGSAAQPLRNRPTSAPLQQRLDGQPGEEADFGPASESGVGLTRVGGGSAR